MTLRDTETGETSDLEATGLFIAIGRTRARSCWPARSTSTTTVTSWCNTLDRPAGVFACGDLVDHHYRQAITAAGTGCAAALDAEPTSPPSTTSPRPPAPRRLTQESVGAGL